MDRFGKDQVIAMDAFASLIAVAALVVAPFALLALAAIRYGADSRSQGVEPQPPVHTRHSERAGQPPSRGSATPRRSR